MTASKVLIKPKERGVIAGLDVSGKQVAVAQTNISLHSLASGKLEGTIAPGRAEGTVLRVRFSPDGKALAFADTKLRGYVHDLESGETHPLELEDKNIQWVDYARKSNRLVVAGVRTQVLDGKTREVIWAMPGGTKKRKEPAVGCLSADGKTVAIAGAERGLVVLHEVDTGKKLGELSGAPDLVRCIDIDPAGLRLACCEVHGNAAALWDLKSGEQLAAEDFADKNGVLTVRFSPDGKHLVLGWLAGAVDVYDAATGERTLFEIEHKQRVWDLAFTADGKSVLSAGDDATVRIRKLT